MKEAHEDAISKRLEAHGSFGVKNAIKLRSVKLRK